MKYKSSSLGVSTSNIILCSKRIQLSSALLSSPLTPLPSLHSIPYVSALDTVFLGNIRSTAALQPDPYPVSIDPLPLAFQPLISPFPSIITQDSTHRIPPRGPHEPLNYPSETTQSIHHVNTRSIHPEHSPPFSARNTRTTSRYRTVRCRTCRRRLIRRRVCSCRIRYWCRL